MDLFTSMIRKCRRRLLLLVVGFLLFELISGHRINSDYDSNELSQQCGKVSRADYRCGYVHSRRQSSDEELEANDEDDDSDQFISLNPNSPAGSWRCKRQMSLAFLANPTNSCSIDCLTTLTSSYNESSGRMTVTNQTNGSQNESTIYCARARNSCGATIPVYLYSLENTGSQFVGETDDLRGKRCKKGTQPLCFAWPFNEDKDNKSRNPTNQMYPRTSIRRRRQVTDDYSSTTVASSTTGQSSTTSVPTTSTGTTTVGTSVASSTTGQSSTTSVSTTTTGTTTVGTSTVLSSTVSTTGSSPRSSSSSPRSSSLTSTQSSTRSSSTVSSSTLSSNTPKTTQSSSPSSTSSSTQRSSTSSSSSTISTPKTTQSSTVWSTTTRPYYSSSYAWNSRSSPTSWNWMALAQRLCSLNVSANYLYSSDLPTTIAQLGVQLNLTTAEINEIIQLVQSLNISQSDIANILSSCQNGGSNGNGGQSPSNDWGTGGGWIGGQIPNWQQGDDDSSNEGNLWPRRGWWSRRSRWRSTTTAWPPSSSTTNYNNTYSSSPISSTTSRYRSNSTDPNNNDYWNGDYGNWNNWNDYDNDNWWNGNRRKVWRWVVLGVCCGIILLLALSILCIAFYRPRVQHRVIVTPYNNQLYTKDARAAEPPPVPISPLESYPEVRY